MWEAPAEILGQFGIYSLYTNWLRTLRRLSCTLLARGRSGTGGDVSARVAGLLIGLDRFDWAAVYGGAVDLLHSCTQGMSICLVGFV